MISGHVWIGISNGMPDENMAGLLYRIRYRMKTLPANRAQHTYKCFGAMSSFTPGYVIHGKSATAFKSSSK